jgi:hypothetical protein
MVHLRSTDSPKDFINLRMKSSLLITVYKVLGIYAWMSLGYLPPSPPYVLIGFSDILVFLLFQESPTSLCCPLCLLCSFYSSLITWAFAITVFKEAPSARHTLSLFYLFFLAFTTFCYIIYLVFILLFYSFFLFFYNSTRMKVYREGMKPEKNKTSRSISCHLTSFLVFI